MRASGAHRRSSATANAGRVPSPPNRENSRDSVAGAGWGGTPENLSALLPPTLQDEPPFSWLRLKVLTTVKSCPQREVPQ
jgi:hypothetical protein